jgi:predicted RNA-binding Zn ribbon-like protein
MTAGEAEPRSAFPDPAVLLCAFANTLDVEKVTDALPDPTSLTDWLRQQGLVDAHARASAADWALARGLRAGLRAAMAAHHDGVLDVDPGLDELTSRLPLRLAFAGTRPRLVPAVGGAAGGLAQLLVAVDALHAASRWERLKLCRADDCQWAFYDTSKNRSRHWCSMGICGNRQKTRTYRARRRAGAP